MRILRMKSGLKSIFILIFKNYGKEIFKYSKIFCFIFYPWIESNYDSKG